MSSELPTDRIEQTRARLRRSRAEVFELAHVLVGEGPANAADPAFPRSHLMRLATGKGGKVLLWGAALGVALMRPKLLWGVARVATTLQPLAIRYLMQRFLG
jgi:hypothetical protein